MNLDKIIKNFKGDEMTATNISQKTLDTIKAEKGREVKVEDLPKETVRDVLLNCISSYKPEDIKDMYLLNSLGTKIASEEDVEFNEKQKNIIVKILEASVVLESKDSPEKEKGIYYSWVVSQVLDELGLNNLQE